jgi:hypothetical protein
MPEHAKFPGEHNQSALTPEVSEADHELSGVEVSAAELAEPGEKIAVLAGETEEFARKVEASGPVGAGVAERARQLARDAIALREEWFGRLSTTLTEQVGEYLVHKEEKAAKKKLDQDWRALEREADRVKKKFVKEFMKDKRDGYVDERWIPVPEGLAQHTKELLLGHRTFKDKFGEEQYMNPYFVRDLVGRLIHQGELDKAMELWSLASMKWMNDYVYFEGMARNMQQVMNQKLNALIEQKIAEGESKETAEVLRVREGRRMDEELSIKCPELAAIMFSEYRSSQYGRFITRYPADIQLNTARGILGREDRSWALESLSPLDSRLVEAMGPEVKRQVFEAYLRTGPRGLVENQDLFKGDFDSLTPAERRPLIDRVAESLAVYYDGSQEGKDLFSFPQNSKYAFAFLENYRLLPEEYEVIRTAIDKGSNYGRHWAEERNKGDALGLRSRFNVLKHRALLKKIFSSYPKALITNGDILLGYQIPNQSPEKREDNLVTFLIAEKKYDVIVAILGYRDDSYQKNPFKKESIAILRREAVLHAEPKIAIQALIGAPGTGDGFMSDEAVREQAFERLIREGRELFLQYALNPGVTAGLGFISLSKVQQQQIIDVVCKDKLGSEIGLLTQFMEKLSSEQQTQLVDAATDKSDPHLYPHFIVQFPSLDAPLRSRIIAQTIEARDADSVAKLGDHLKFLSNVESEEFVAVALEVITDSEAIERLLKKVLDLDEISGATGRLGAIRYYAQTIEVPESSVVKAFVDRFIQGGQEAAEDYIESLKERAGNLIGEHVPDAERAMPEYGFLVKYAFPAGNYSSHEKNLASGDRTEHIKSYDFERTGYPVTLTGLTGYRLRRIKGERGEEIMLQEDRGLLSRYQKRLQTIQGSIESYGSHNIDAQRGFASKLDDLFGKYAESSFKALGSENLSAKEKMVVLFISEALRRRGEEGFVPNQTILDLIVEYKYVYHEDLGAYVQRSAHDVQQYKDETSQRYLLWQELSTIYGENTKHVLRHNIFEDLAQSGEHYAEIVDAFGAALSESSERFAMAPREMQSLENVLKKKLPREELYALVINKLADLYGPNDKSKGDDKKKAEYDAERNAFVEYAKKIIPLGADPLEVGTIADHFADAFAVHPQHLRRFENTFTNQAIADENRFKILRKQVSDIFGSNIRFGNDEDKDAFESSIDQSLEPLGSRLDMKTLLTVLPKLRTLRNQHRFGVGTKLEELFAMDLNAINREIAKFEEVTEVEAKETQMQGPKEKLVKKSAKKRNIRTFIAKTQETANARMGAYLCISGDESMWQNKNYFEAVDKDEDTGKCVGLTMMLNIEAKNGKRYLWVGPNPFESFLTQVSAEKAFEHQYQVAIDVASRNGFDGIVVPPEDGQILGACTNRGGTFPDLIKAKRLRDKKGDLKIADFGEEHKLGGGYGYSKGALIWER